MKYQHLFISFSFLLCTNFALAASTTVAPTANPQVEFQTSQGTFVIELYPDKAPKTVANFLQYVNNGFYPGTTFHRTIKRFMIQGGGLTPELKDKGAAGPVIGGDVVGTLRSNLLLPPIVNESNNGLKNEPGMVAMARAFEPNSATSQFFINLADNKFLNFYRDDPHYIGYCVFGRVIQGLAVAQRISQVDTTNVGAFTNVPVDPITIDKVTLLDKPVTAEAGTKPEQNEQPSSSKPIRKGKKRG